MLSFKFINNLIKVIRKQELFIYKINLTDNEILYLSDNGIYVYPIMVSADFVNYSFGLKYYIFSIYPLNKIKMYPSKFYYND